MKKWLLAFLVMTLALQVRAEDQASTADLTLQQAVQDAQNHSPYYQQAQAKERETSWSQLEAWSDGFIPKLTVKGQYFLPDPQYST